MDLDETILDFKKAEKLALTQTLETMGLNPEEEILKRYSVINQQKWELLEKKVLTRAQVLTGRFEQLFEEYKVDRPATEAQKHYEANLANGCFFLKGSKEFLDTLKQNPEYRLYLASNGTARVQDQRIKDGDLAKYFDEIFISEKLGADKPSKEYFARCFKIIEDKCKNQFCKDGFDKNRAVIIGDSLTSDIQGGINAGIHTIWYNPFGTQNKTLGSEHEIIPEYVANDYKEILRILDGC